MMSPFDLSQTLPGGGGLLVPGSLPGSPVLKQLMQIVTMVPGHVVSVSVLPLTLTCMKKKTLSAQTCTMCGRKDSLCFAWELTLKKIKI